MSDTRIHLIDNAEKKLSSIFRNVMSMRNFLEETQSTAIRYSAQRPMSDTKQRH